MQHLSIRSSLASVFQIPLRPATRTVSKSTTRLPSSRLRPNALSTPARLPFSSSTPKSLAAKKKKGPGLDRRITLIRHFLYHPTTLTPRPLRFSRNRSLRHWTIRRAWSLFTSKRRQERDLELERQYNSMAAACEELRVGVGDGGKLFRKAMMKTNLWSIPERGGGVPIEYARGLSEWVGGGTGTGKGEGRIWDSAWKPLQTGK